ncbi:hypothetical protein ALC53_05853 [Atta colombica]|uniref:Uncharacterized protein n=1 Tax=Atta colombica TaxID=520822 RepID=A0A151I3A3_9HYME|nr:hypothetical protein ALC53_05853 [Atta colombica]
MRRVINFLHIKIKYRKRGNVKHRIDYHSRMLRGHCSNFRHGLKGRFKMLMRIKSSTQSNAYLSGLAVIRRFGGRGKVQSWEVQSADAPRRKPTITDR